MSLPEATSARDTSSAARPLLGISKIPAQNILDQFLPSGPRPRRDAFGDRSIRQRPQGHLAVKDRTAEFASPTGISLRDDCRQFAALDHCGSVEEPASHRIYPSAVRVEEIGRVDAL